MVYFQVIWVCILCRKKQELLTKTGSWINVHQDMHTDHEFSGTLQPSTSFLNTEKRPKLERSLTSDSPGRSNEAIFPFNFFSGSKNQRDQPDLNQTQLPNKAFVNSSVRGKGILQRSGSVPTRELPRHHSLEREILDPVERKTAREGKGKLGEEFYGSEMHNFLPTNLAGSDIHYFQRGYSQMSEGSSSYGGGSPFDYVGYGSTSNIAVDDRISPMECGSISGSMIEYGRSSPVYPNTNSMTDISSHSLEASGVSRNRKKCEINFRNDSFSSDPSEGLRRPSPIKNYGRDRRTRRNSLSSSDEDIRSDDIRSNGTSCDDQEVDRDRYRERGKFEI